MKKIHKFKTTVEWLGEMIKGKLEPFRCSGYPMPNSHEPVDYEIIVERHFYSYGCPTCGFGQGGSLSENDYEYLRDLYLRSCKESAKNEK